MSYFVLAVVIIFLILILNFVIPHFVKLFLKRNYLKKLEKSGNIFLTFDDGPDVNSTGEILDILSKNKIKATFFVLGNNAQKNKALIERMINEGHTVGIHGSSHLHPWKVKPWKALSDIVEGNKILKNLGVKTHYIRPPFGKLNLFTMSYILINKLTFVHWNVDTRDYEEKEPEKLNKLLQKKVTSGKIILLHDGRINITTPVSVTAKGLDLFLQNMHTELKLFSAISSVI